MRRQNAKKWTKSGLFFFLQFVATPTRKKEEKLVHKHSLQQ
jgi:hypothetical protein